MDSHYAAKLIKAIENVAVELARQNEELTLIRKQFESVTGDAGTVGRRPAIRIINTNTGSE